MAWTQEKGYFTQTASRRIGQGSFYSAGDGGLQPCTAPRSREEILVSHQGSRRMASMTSSSVRAQRSATLHRWQAKAHSLPSLPCQGWQPDGGCRTAFRSGEWEWEGAGAAMSGSAPRCTHSLGVTGGRLVGGCLSHQRRVQLALSKRLGNASPLHCRCLLPIAGLLLLAVVGALAGQQLAPLLLPWRQLTAGQAGTGAGRRQDEVRAGKAGSAGLVEETGGPCVPRGKIGRGRSGRACGRLSGAAAGCCCCQAMLSGL